jgi:hypothetical protein
MDFLTITADKVGLPKFAVGQDGYSLAVSTTESRLVVAPSQVPALLAQYFNDGLAGRPVGALFAPGPYTTERVKGALARIQALKAQSVRSQVSWASPVDAVRHLYALQDGSTLILFVLEDNDLSTGYGISRCPNGFGYNYAFGPHRQERLSSAQFHDLDAIVAIDPTLKPAGTAASTADTAALSVLGVNTAAVSIDATPC